jgi:hypothetical protein
LQVLEVYSPPGIVAGTIEQNWAIFSSKFTVKNALGEEVFKIRGPWLKTSLCRKDIKFRVLTMEGLQVGQLSKKWSGYIQECCTDVDNFWMSFPEDLDVKMKAVMMGAAILIVST